MSEHSYLHHFSAQVSQSVFLAYLTVFIISTHFSAPSITKRTTKRFLAYLTVLRLITTVWPEMSELSYLRHFSALVSQIVFLPYFTVLRLITTVWPEFQKIHISDISVHKDHKSCSYLIWPFYDLLQQYDLKSQKTHISTILVHKCHKSCSSLFWPFYSLLQPYDLKCQKTHISTISMHKYHKAFS